jgi:hypothetical protein
MSFLKSPTQQQAEKDQQLAEFSDQNRLADQALAVRFAQLAKKIGDAEEYFASLRLPGLIFVAYNQEQGEFSPHDDQWEGLGFIKLSGKWRLCYAYVNQAMLDVIEGPEWKPLVDCSTDIRLEAIGKLHELKMEALRAKEEYARKVDEAMNEIDKVLAK